MGRGPRHLLLMLLAIAGAAELAARGDGGPLGPAREEERVYLERGPLSPFFVLKDGRWTAARPRAKPESFPDARPPGRKLVFIAGESVAQRLPSEELRAALAVRGYDAEVAGAGMGGYGSAAVRATLDRLLERKPDAVVILEGNNGPGPRVGGLVSSLASSSALARRLDARLAFPADPEAAFEADLRASARAARAAGARVVLATLPVNLELPPAGELPLFDAAFREGWLALDGGDARAALEPLARAEKALPSDPFPPFARGRALAEAGRREEARAELSAALERDAPQRCPPARQAAIRKIAAEEGAALADLEAAFASAGADGRAFLDEVHWRDAWQPLAADALGAALAGGEPKTAAPAPAPLSRTEAADLLRHALALSIQAGEGGPAVLHERLVAELARVRRDAPAAFERSLGSRDGARALLETSDWTRAFARPSDDGWAGALTHAAEARWRDAPAKDARARAAALDGLREAAKLRPDDGLAPRLLGQHLLQLGRAEEGRAALASVPRGSRDALLATALLAGAR